MENIVDQNKHVPLAYDSQDNVEGIVPFNETYFPLLAINVVSLIFLIKCQ